MDSLRPLRFNGAVGTLRFVSASCERGDQLVRCLPRQIHHLEPELVQQAGLSFDQEVDDRFGASENAADTLVPKLRLSTVRTARPTLSLSKCASKVAKRIVDSRMLAACATQKPMCRTGKRTTTTTTRLS